MANTPNQLMPIETDISTKIFTLRGVQVMLDRDIAVFYGVKPIRLREQIKRNIKRFPEDFMFQLDDAEVDLMVSQNAIPSRQHLGGSLPYAFTEHGVSMISAVLKTEQAVEVSVQIIRVFVDMKKFFIQNAALFSRLDTLETKHLQYKLETDAKFDRIFDAIESKTLTPKQHLFYDGQIFDAHLFVSDLIRSANTSLILIDNYIDETTLSLFSKRALTCKATIYTKSISRQLEIDLAKYNQQYPSVELKTFAQAHDRFLIIDETELYHFGASLKDLGKKWFAVSKMELGTLGLLERLP